MTLHAMVQAALARGADTVALRQKRHGIWHEMTWRQLVAAAAAMARGIAAQGLAPGAQVAIVADPSEYWIAAVLGAWLGGFAPLPLSPELPQEDLAALLATADALLHDSPGEWDIAIPATIRLRLGPPDTGIDPGDPALPPETVVADLLMAHTAPDGGMHLAAVALAELAATATSLCQAHGITAADTTLAVLPPGDPMGLTVALLVPLLTGCVVHFGESTRTFAADLRQAEVTLLVGPPRLWRKLHADVALAAERAGGPRRMALRAALRGTGGPIARALINAPLRRRLGLRRLRVALCVGAASAATSRFFDGLGIAIAGETGAPGLTGSLNLRHALTLPSGVALVQPDFDLLAAWAARQSLAFTNYASLIALPEAQTFIDGEIRRANQELPAAERPTGYVLAPEPLSVVGGALTPGLAIRRHAAEALVASEGIVSL